MKPDARNLWKRDGIFYVVCRRNGKRVVVSTGCRTLSAAAAKRDEILAPFAVRDEVKTLEALAGRIAGRSAELARMEAERTPGLTVAEGWGAYLHAGNRPDTGAATLEQYEVQYDRFRRWLAAAHPEAVNMADVTPDTAREFRAHLEHEKRSPRTVNAYLNLLALVWRVLAEPARAAVNPWKAEHVTRRRQEKGTGRKELSVDVLRRVIEGADGELRTLFAVGLYCGLRLGDACRLTWDEVDLARGAIVTQPHKTAGTSGATVAIPIAPPLRRVLDSIRPAKPRGPIMPELAGLYTRRPRGVVQMVQDHFTKCGVETTATAANRERARVLVGFHSLRHSFVSHAAMSGWPESLVRAIVGHTSANVTKRYLHLSTLAVKSLQPLPDVLAPAAAPPILPAPTTLDWRAEVLRIVDTMNSETWKSARDALQKLAAAKGTREHHHHDRRQAPAFLYLPVRRQERAFVPPQVEGQDHRDLPRRL